MKRNDFTEKAKQGIQDLSDKIDELENKAKSASDDLKAEYKEQIKALDKKKSALEHKYNEVKDMAEDKWEETKESFKTGMESLKDTFKHLFD